MNATDAAHDQPETPRQVQNAYAPPGRSFRNTVSTTLAIAGNTVRESIRQPLFLILLGLGALLVMLSPYFAEFSFRESYKLIVDLSLASMLMAAFLISVVLSSAAMADEIENRTALTVLAKPVSRAQFVIGKFIGVTLVGWMTVWILGGLSFLVARSAIPDSFIINDPYYRLVTGWGIWGFLWATGMYLFAKLAGDRPFATPALIAATVFMPFAATGMTSLYNKLPYDTIHSDAFRMHWLAPVVAVSVIGLAAAYKGNADRKRDISPTAFLLGTALSAFIFIVGYLHLLDVYVWEHVNDIPALNTYAPYWPTDLLIAPAFGSLYVMIIIAWAILFSTRMSLIPTTLFSITLLGGGHLLSLAESAVRRPDGGIPFLWYILSAPFPNLDLFMVNDTLARGYLQAPAHFAAGHLGYAAAHAVLNSLFAIMIASAVFEFREIT